MRLLRSWPATIPASRAYVQDDLERLIMDGHDYRVLADVDDDIVLIEWDIAVGKEDLEAFAARARATPERVLVAPYRLYHFASGTDRPRPLWAHRRYEGSPETGRLIHVQPDEPVCHLFGLGMAYLPRALVREFLDAWPGHVSDGSFSGWHYRNAPYPDVPVTWDIRPVHLHYQLPDLA